MIRTIGFSIVGIVSTKILKNIGGFDCSFEGTAMAHADLGVRLQKNNIKVKLMNIPLLLCTHLTGQSRRSSDRFMIGQIDHDQPLFKKIWNTPEAVDRIYIDLENWKDSPEVWERRFNRDGTRKI